MTTPAVERPALRERMPAARATGPPEPAQTARDLAAKPWAYFNPSSANAQRPSERSFAALRRLRMTTPRGGAPRLARADAGRARDRSSRARGDGEGSHCEALGVFQPLVRQRPTSQREILRRASPAQDDSAFAASGFRASASATQARPLFPCTAGRHAIRMRSCLERNPQRTPRSPWSRKKCRHESRIALPAE